MGGALKPREDRRPVSVRARLRTEAGWSDVTIGNVSSRGLLLRCVSPPPQRAYIEVRHQGVCIVGRIVWTSGGHCGVRAQDRIDVAGLLSPASRPSKPVANDRRAASRPTDRPGRPPPAERAEASRRFSRLFDFAAVALAVTCAAGIAANVAFDAFSAPIVRTVDTLVAANAR